MSIPADIPGFDDGKAPDALRTIGEVARALGIRQHVLRYWEEQFPALQPIKRSGGRRYYRPEDVALIARIDQLVHREGYTLKGAAKALAAKPEAAAPQPAAAPAATPVDADTAAQIDELYYELLEIRRGLAQALASA